MSFFLPRLLVAALTLAAPPWLAPAAAADAPAASVPERPRAPNDESAYRRFVLPNGMKVILLSDPKLNNSAASLAVGVGNLADPPNRQGLAHFLEHMVFLGTEKYPSVTDFDQYLGRNGGLNNAYTASDRTNYHFEIRHEAFAGALDRFAQFFIAPLFDPRFTEREINAVNSEHQKNLENDMWREFALRNLNFREGHPGRKFGTGNKETLGGTTREELLAFHRQHYSANRMTLALTGPASLDELEKLARTHFGPVPNLQRPELRYPADFLPPKPALRVLRMEPVKDLRSMTLTFPLPDLRATVQSKPTDLIGFVLGNEGPGSLLAQLKREGLATGISVGSEQDTPDYGAFEMRISLTPEGLAQYPRILALVFSTVAQLQRVGVPPHLFKERQTLARLDEMYRDKGDGVMRAVPLANALMDHPIELAERVPFLWTQEDPAALRRVLGQLRPDNLLVTLVAKGLATDKTAPIYGTRYGYSEDTGPAYAALLAPPTVAGITLPKPNPYVPARTTLLPVQPLKLIDESGLSLYYAQDTEFQRPLAAHVLRFRLPRSMATLRNAVLLRLYTEAVKESLNESTYAAAEAGLRFTIGGSLDGIQLAVEGYDDAVGKLLDVLAAGLVEIPLPAERFAALKERVLRELSGFEQIDAHLAVAEARRRALREFHWRPDEELPIARDITLAQVKAFAQQLYRRGKLEALSYGNLTAAQASAAVRRAAAGLNTTAVPEAELLKRRALVSPAGEALRSSQSLKVNNSAFRREVVLGSDSAELRAAAMVLSNFIADPFYSELRTRQQLGYIVGSTLAEEARQIFLAFIIQSGEYPADVLEERADAFIRTFPALLAALPDDGWATLVAGVRAKLEEKDKSIADRAARFFDLAYERNADFNRRETTLAALATLGKARAGELLSSALAASTARSRTFLGFSREHQPKSPPAVSFTDVEAWKAKQRYD